MADARGFDFPFRGDSGGFPQPATDTTRVGAQIRQILLTELGERLMRPAFGSVLRSFLFENIDAITVEAIRAEVARALINSDADILLLDVQIVVENSNTELQPTVVVINVLYDRLGRRDEVSVSLSASGGLTTT